VIDADAYAEEAEQEDESGTTAGDQAHVRGASLSILLTTSLLFILSVV